MNKLNKIVAGCLVVSLTVADALTASAEDKPKPQVLFANVNIFDGKSDKLNMGQNVLVEGNVIKAIGKGLKARSGATVIDGGGRTLMPGLIDMHSHLSFAWPSLAAVESATWEAIGARTALAAKETLMDGFTTVRDAGGMNGKGVKK